MMDNLTPEVFRGIERLGTVVFGGLSIYWGYRLFDRVTETAGELAAKGGGFNLNLKNVAPGVFFAVFGMAVLITSLSTQLVWTRSGGGRADMDAQKAAEISSNANAGSDTQEKLVFGQGGIATGRQNRFIGALQDVKQAAAYVEKTPSPDKIAKKVAVANLQNAKALLLEESFTPEIIQQFRDKRLQVASNPDVYNKMKDTERQQYDFILNLIKE